MLWLLNYSWSLMMNIFISLRGLPQQEVWEAEKAEHNSKFQTACNFKVVRKCIHIDVKQIKRRECKEFIKSFLTITESVCMGTWKDIYVLKIPHLKKKRNTKCTQIYTHIRTHTNCDVICHKTILKKWIASPFQSYFAT